MSDPRYTDPRYKDSVNDPGPIGSREPMSSGSSRDNVEDDAGRGGMWAWIVGIIAVIVVAMVIYDYNRPISTATNPPVNPPSTTGSAPAPTLPPTPEPKSP